MTEQIIDPAAATQEPSEFPDGREEVPLADRIGEKEMLRNKVMRVLFHYTSDQGSPGEYWLGLNQMGFLTDKEIRGWASLAEWNELPSRFQKLLFQSYGVEPPRGSAQGRKQVRNAYQVGYLLGGAGAKNFNASSMTTATLTKLDTYLKAQKIDLTCEMDGAQPFDFTWQTGERKKGLIAENNSENKKKYGPLWKSIFPSANWDERVLCIPENIMRFMVSRTGSDFTGKPDLMLARWLAVELKNKPEKFYQGRRAIFADVMLMSYDQLVTGSSNVVPIAFLTDMKTANCYAGWFEEDEKSDEGDLLRVECRLNQVAMVVLMKGLLGINQIDESAPGPLVEIFKRMEKRVNPFADFFGPRESTADVEMFDAYLDDDAPDYAFNFAVRAEVTNGAMFHHPRSPYWDGNDEDMDESGGQDPGLYVNREMLSLLPFAESLEERRDICASAFMYYDGSKWV